MTSCHRGIQPAEADNDADAEECSSKSVPVGTSSCQGRDQLIASFQQWIAVARLRDVTPDVLQKDVHIRSK